MEVIVCIKVDDFPITFALNIDKTLLVLGLDRETLVRTHLWYIAVSRYFSLIEPVPANWTEPRA